MWKIPPNFQAKSLPDQILSRNPRSYFAVMDIYTPKCSFILLFLGSKFVAVVGSPSVMEHLSFWEPRGGTLPEKVDLSKGGPPTPRAQVQKRRRKGLLILQTQIHGMTNFHYHCKAPGSGLLNGWFPLGDGFFFCFGL